MISGMELVLATSGLIPLHLAELLLLHLQSVLVPHRSVERVMQVVLLRTSTLLDSLRGG